LILKDGNKKSVTFPGNACPNFKIGPENQTKIDENIPTCTTFVQTRLPLAQSATTCPQPTMRIPYWKKWLSHLTAITVEEAASEQNPELAVVLDRGRLQLLSGDAIYSWDDLYKNFDLAFDTLDIQNLPVNDVLILGLGLGSVPFLLEKKYGRMYHYTAVEWDETVAELAEKYTFSRLKSPISVIIADAEIFVQVCEDQYDLLIADIFEDDLTPPQFESALFLQSCHKLLRPGGLFLFNRLYGDHKDKVATERFFERTFLAEFPEAWRIDTKGNWILCHRVPIRD
jgi:SAM-dependent methyltransferase